VTLKTSTPQLL